MPESLSYSRIYYDILRTIAVDDNDCANNLSILLSSPVPEDINTTESGCVDIDCLSPSLRDAIDEINVNRNKLRAVFADSINALGISDDNRLSGGTHGSQADESDAYWRCMTVPSDVGHRGFDFFDDCLATTGTADHLSHNDGSNEAASSPLRHDAGNPQERKHDWPIDMEEVIFPIMESPKCAGEGLSTIPYPLSAANHRSPRGMDKTMQYNELKLEDIIVFRKLSVINCVDDMSLLKYGECHDEFGNEFSSKIHHDASDIYTLWVPIRDPYESLPCFKVGEHHLKIIVKKSVPANERSSLTTVEEIDDIISSPMMGSVPFTSDVISSHSEDSIKCSKELDIRSSIKSEPAMHLIQRESTDDFSSLLDETFFSANQSVDSIAQPPMGISHPGNDIFTTQQNTCGPPSVEADAITNDVCMWAYNSAGEIKDIRTLLYTLLQVLWQDAHWQPIDIATCADDRNAIRKHYRNALLLCHPDKHMRSDWRKALRARLLTQALHEAWSKLS